MSEHNRRARLLVLTSTYPRWTGDTEPRFVHELSARLTDSFEVLVLCPAAPGARGEEEMDGVQVRRYRYGPRLLQTLVNEGGVLGNIRRRPWKLALVPLMLAAQCWATWRLLRSWRPDVIHAHWVIPQGLIAAVLRGLGATRAPILLTSHGSDLFALRARALQWLKRITVRRAAALAVVSSAMREELDRQRIRATRLVVEPMGADLVDCFRFDASVVRELQTILFVGRLVRSKGAHVAIAALALVRRTHPEVRLEVVGDGPQMPALRDQAVQAGLEARVSFIGAMSHRELAKRYRSSRLLVLPFERDANEGLGLVLVEAAGCGCPVIAGDLPAVRDVIGSPVTGCLVPAGDAVALAEAIAQRISEPRESTDTELARARSVARFDWSARADAYATLLRSLLPGNQSVQPQAAKTSR